MPVKELSGQELKGFLGVNLRQDRVSLADIDLAKAINADLHTQPGAVILRLGRATQFTTALAAAIRRLAKINSVRYQVAGTVLYRNQTSILTGLSANLFTTIIPFRPLNDTTTWALIADDALMRKDNGTTVRTWGIVAPTATPSVNSSGVGELVGSYSVRFTYVRKVGSSVAHESNPSPSSAAINIDASVPSTIAITGLTASTDPQVTHVRLYRTVGNGVIHLFDQELTNGTTTATSTIADSALGTAVETDNDPPPDASWVTEFQSQAFLCRDAVNPHYLWFSKRFRPESFPPDNFIEIGSPADPLQCAVPIVGMLGTFTRQTKYRVTGSDSSGFVAFEALSRRGTPSPQAVKATERGICFVARDGVFLTNLVEPDQELSEAIAPIFWGESVNGISAVNWDAASTMAAEYWKGRYYLSLPTGTATSPNVVAVFSTTTKRWYFYDHPVRSLLVEEDLDDLTAGATDGFVYILEEGSSDAGSSIALDVQTADRFGTVVEHRKLFLWIKVDADTLGESISVDMYVDGVLQRTATLNSSRGKPILHFPASAMGYTWRLGFRYTGTKRIRIYGAAALWMPLEPV